MLLKPKQHSCLGMCKILLCSISFFIKFGVFIDISLVGQVPIIGSRVNTDYRVPKLCTLCTARFFNSWWHHQMETFSVSLAFVRGINRSPVNSLHKGQWRGVLMFSLICTWIYGWLNNGEAGDLRRQGPLWPQCNVNIYLNRITDSLEKIWRNNVILCSQYCS